MSKNVFILDHPLAGSYLKLLRDKNSSPEVFRKQISRMVHMLAIEATCDLQTNQESCETPICQTQENVLSERVGLVPILRAGIGMVDPFLDFIPQAEVMFIGMQRDEETHQPIEYYNKLSQSKPMDTVYIIDPMLATGGSAILTIDAIKKWGAKNIKFVGLIGSPEGVEAVHNEFPEIDIHLAALDERLNENAYIVPGLGDAGDRIFNT